MSPTTYSQLGRSLLELCASLGFFTIMSMISAPHFSKLREQIQLKNFSSAISDLIEQSTSLARFYQSDLQIYRDSDKIVIHNNLVQAKDIRQLSIPKNLNVEIETIDKKIHAYQSNTLSPGTLTISSKNRNCTVTFSLRARVRQHCD